MVSWDTREQILERLGASHAAVGEAFRDVGASHPVMLTIDEKQQLLDRIDKWKKEVGADHLPDGVSDLRRGLRNDMRGAGRGLELFAALARSILRGVLTAAVRMTRAGVRGQLLAGPVSLGYAARNGNGVGLADVSNVGAGATARCGG